MSSILLAVIATPCITTVVLLAMVLRFAKTMVDQNHGDTKCLRDIAVLLRAFRSAPGGLLATLAKIISRR